LGIDNILRLKLLTRDELEEALGFKFAKRNLLITFHPVTLEQGASAGQMDELLGALSELKNTGLIFTMPNADTDGRVLFEKIERFCAEHPQARAYTSLGQLRYLSCIQHVDGVVGNSSSGLLEVPSFKKVTINIGDRQRGRLKAPSVIDCEPERKSIRMALEHLFSAEFQVTLSEVESPYGNGGASNIIVNILAQSNLNLKIKKIRRYRADSKVKCNAYQSSKVRRCTTPHPNAINNFSPKSA
jgi:GDP/UDP-N,N'-diacetylbacillosamine 2-epimerase (hydrolysing)